MSEKKIDLKYAETIINLRAEVERLQAKVLHLTINIDVSHNDIDRLTAERDRLKAALEKIQMETLQMWTTWNPTLSNISDIARAALESVK